MISNVTGSQWAQFDQDGYVILRQVVPQGTIEALCQRIDEIMLGEAGLDYDRMLMQLDSDDGAYDSAGEQSRGHKGSTLNYRKIQQLEKDPAFLAFMQMPLFEAAARHFYGDNAIAIFRAMFMNKPAGRGTSLPLHQDRWRVLDKDPRLTIYTALDAADTDNGCVEIIPGTQHEILNTRHPSGFLTPEMASEYAQHPRRQPLILAAGDVVLMNPWTLHASGINASNRPRRAFSVCLMDAATKNMRYNRVASRVILFDEVTPA
jgi:hypothetical protein